MNVLTPVTREGQIALIMRSEAERNANASMESMVEICERRAYDEDPEVRQLVHTVLYQYAASRGVDITLITTHRTQ